MISNDLLEYYESLVHYQGQAPAEENPHLREYVAELRGIWESRVILRELRNRAAIPNRFVWPPVIDDCLHLTPARLIEGVDWRRTVPVETPRRRPRLWSLFPPRSMV